MIIEIGRCDYCEDDNVEVRGTPFLADIPANMCKICWNMTRKEYLACEETDIGEFEVLKERESIDLEDDECCSTCCNGSQVCDSDIGYCIQCKLTDEYKDPSDICEKY